MKRLSTLFTRLLIVLCLPVAGFAQNNYSIELNSGKFTPEANMQTVSRNADVFTYSKFDHKYYVVVQFKSLPGFAEREQMRAAGLELTDYIPNLAYTAQISESLSLDALKELPIRSIFRFSVRQKMPGDLYRGVIPSHARKLNGFVDINVVTYEKIPLAKAITSFSLAGAMLVEDNSEHFRTFVLRVPTSKVHAIAELHFVQWVEPITPQPVEENLPGRTLHRVNVLNDGVRNLKGDGINVGIWDGGEVSPHVDFSPAGRLTLLETSAPSDHSTHCAGTICGRGLINPIARGMAPNANLFSSNFSGNIQNEMTAAIPANNLLVSSHSYGFTFGGACNLTNSLLVYDNLSRNTDIVLNTFANHLQVHSAGNAGSSCAGGFHTITGSGKPAKNNLVVGALTTTDGITSFSSSGPVQDGRIKPEITAFGNNVFSTSTPLNSYTTMSGTSMATPGVSGASVLLYQRYNQLTGNTASSTLIKNIICNGAHDLGPAGPDYRYGFGRINALNSVEILEENRYALNNVTTGNSIDQSITVPANTCRLKVMLTWNDPAGAANANPALVNNLDLSVINGATTTLPWVLDKNNPGSLATRAVDNISNIEQVTIDNPPSGSYTLRVAGTAVPTGPNQPYALSWIIDPAHVKVQYPNGGEIFAPGTSEIITWDNACATSNQILEYSIDNGGSWTTIASVSAATTRHTWTVPSASTSQALIRITSGSLVDISDATFTIFSGAPTGFTVSGASCVAGDISFTWNALAGATHYDIFMLNPTSGNYELLAGNLTGTSHTQGGLPPGVTRWFYIVGKNNSTGVVSLRSNAVSGVVSSGGGGLGAIGSITGQTTICGSPTAEPYSVPAVSGATNYTWTAPPGASIASGQGTTNITINYTGASSGNVTVFASNGSCQTSTASLPVAVGSGSIAAPISGGNQSAVSCPPTPTPTLTATATVPAGHTVVWYTAATGGSVVASPTLNTVGSVTYYAASRNTSTGCEGTTRTPVTLTITAAPPPTVTASGPTTFCDGGSVQLTANPGSSYAWSNGATTQSITVLTGGTFTVTVTQTGGCTGTSAPVTVTVNAKPIATITASGPLSFCSGGSVTLTAQPGVSWLWTTGATTQSINVTSNSNHGVTVTDANGCSDAAPPVSVAVTNTPAVTITAAPYTNLLPGQQTSLTANVAPSGSYNYAWFKNGVLIPGASASTLGGIDISDIGSYTVTVTRASGLPCPSTSDALAIGANPTNKLFIFPSPTSGQFKITYYVPSAQQGNVIGIYDYKGALVLSKTHNMNLAYQTIDFDMSKFSKGIYRVLLVNAAGKRISQGTVVIQ